MSVSIRCSRWVTVFGCRWRASAVAGSTLPVVKIGLQRLQQISPAFAVVLTNAGKGLIGEVQQLIGIIQLQQQPTDPKLLECHRDI